MVPFALDACALMAASLSSVQPANPRKQMLNRASVNPRVNNLMMGMTSSPHNGPSPPASTRRHSDPPATHPGPLFVLPELREGGKAELIIGNVAKHKPVPGSGL